MTATDLAVHEQSSHHSTRGIVDGRALRSAMSHFATGVTVVTAAGRDGAPTGSTANAVTSVSLAPPLVLVCLRRGSRTLEAVVAAGQFALNVLGDGHEGLARTFARATSRTTTRDRFTDVAWRPGRHGAPLLDAATTTLECTIHRVVPGGDHAVVIGHVHDLDHPALPAEPLVFFGGRFRRLQATSPEPPSAIRTTPAGET